MTFHRDIHLAPLCQSAQFQFAIEGITASNITIAPLVAAFCIFKPSIEIALNRQT